MWVPAAAGRPTSEEFLEEPSYPSREPADRARAGGLVPLRPLCVAKQPGSGCEHRTVDVIGQTAERRRAPATDRQIEDLFGDLRDPVQQGGAAGQHDPRVQRFLVAGPAKL